MEQPKISVIVPVYNAESTIERCVDSILSQSFPDFELWLIDDGSKDRSAELCKKYAESDIRVQYKWKMNGGVSPTRNLGIHEARGEYLTFVDSDDYLEPSALKALFQAAEKYQADYVMPRMKGVYFTEEGEHLKDVFHKDDFDLVVSQNNLDKSFEQLVRSSACISTCGRLYRRSMVNANSLHFDCDVHMLEDFCFNLGVLEKAETIVHIDMIAYSYTVKGIENKGYQHDYRVIMEGNKNAYNKLFPFLKRKQLPIRPAYADLLMTNWVQAVQVVQNSQMKRWRKITVLREIAGEVRHEKLIAYCTKEAVDTHYRALFQTGSPWVFYAVNKLKSVKKRIEREDANDNS